MKFRSPTKNFKRAFWLWGVLSASRVKFWSENCKTCRAILWGGETYHGVRPQTQFWRLQKVGLLWSAPVSSTGGLAWTNRGKFSRRGPRTTHHPHKRPGILGGSVCELSEPKKKAKYAPPPVCTRDVDRRLCGGGAWISWSEHKNFKRSNFQPNGPAEVQCECFLPDFWVEFWKVNFGRWISRRWIFLGASFADKKKDEKNPPKTSGPIFGRPKFVSQNSAPNSGFGGAKSHVSWEKKVALQVWNFYAVFTHFLRFFDATNSFIHRQSVVEGHNGPGHPEQLYLCLCQVGCLV